ncbi:hypothetical protein RchiOBHm_Chr6g0270811 [Rosa chinensis]|uniref:Uncharacterized protein n=1 Tax=Rosa chinensis TaxID=74649 RepID=A0A2P6PQU0_ROSCH|nr:ATPase family AAA domain-containing protein At1g05910-like [Rosa chinensis]PRQ24294.1 hypothetical protein RchiOBHm_Chr6g0270811 [Rosa chinensis]
MVAYNGDDYNGARIVSRGYELRDAVDGMLSQMDPALIAYCDKIAADGGPEHIPEALGVTTFPSIHVVQLGTVTRASARLRNVQPEVNLDHSYEAHKRPKKNIDAAPAASAAEDKSQHQGSVPSTSSQEPETNNTDLEVPETSPVVLNQLETFEVVEVSGHADASGSEDIKMLDGEITNQMESVKRLFVE